MQITWDQGYLLILIIKYFKIVLLTFNVGVLQKKKQSWISSYIFIHIVYVKENTISF